MAKKRKTRQEKILSDSRPLKAGLGSTTFSYARPQGLTKATSLPPTSTTTSSIYTNDYSHVGKDLRHTALITGAIILAELVIFFFIRSI